MDTPHGNGVAEARRRFIRALHQELLGRDVDDEALAARVREFAHLTAEEVFAVFVGSGHSSAVTLDIVRGRLGDAARCLFIDPYPDRLESLLLPGDREVIEILPAPVQAVGLEVYDRLGAGDILFIDSTHVVKTGSDVVHHLARVLPRLRPGVLVHFHDIFHPFEYPEQWAIAENRSWNEIYCLHAFLQGNADYEIVFFNDWFARMHRDFLERRMPLVLANPGGGLWLRKLR